jgi:hypothetical protein
VSLKDGRTVRAPVDRFDLLRSADEHKLTHVELNVAGTGLRWPELDEDLSVGGLIRDFGAI